MASLPNTKTVTCEEWIRMPEVQDAIEEVVNGEIRIMPPPKWNHSEIVDNLFFLIRSQVNPKEIDVKASTFGLFIRLEPLTSRVPDLAVFDRATIQLRVDGLLQPKLFPHVQVDIAQIWPD